VRRGSTLSRHSDARNAADALLERARIERRHPERYSLLLRGEELAAPLERLVAVDVAASPAAREPGQDLDRLPRALLDRLLLRDLHQRFVAPLESSRTRCLRRCLLASAFGAASTERARSCAGTSLPRDTSIGADSS